MKKTLLVGLDAACWQYIDPLLIAGRMPTLQKLMDIGVCGTMRSTMPPWTPTAWASIVTGKNPGKHGVFDMLWRRPGSYEFSPTNARVTQGTPFWRRLNEHGVRVGLVNVPFTHPPEELDGFLVTGFGTPTAVSDFAYPPDLSQWILQEIGDYRPSLAPELLQSASPAEILEAELRHQEQQIRIASALIKCIPVDVLVINLMATDHANHKMPLMEQVEAAYRRSDAHLNDLLRAFTPDNVMLISDHGSSRLKGEFLLDAWLHDQGYSVQLENTADERRAALNWLLAKWLRDHVGLSGTREKIVRRFMCQTLPMLPAPLSEQFWSRVETVYPFARDYIFYNSEVDYERSQVFPGSVYSGLLYLNLAGRESKGNVPEQERESLVAEIAAKLAAIEETETGRPLFSRVYRAEELYSGPEVDRAPDIIIDGYDSDWNIRTRRHELPPQPPHHRYFLAVTTAGEYGWHSRDGIFALSGHDFSTGPAAGEIDLVDVAATLLHLYGVPVPDDYDGRVLAEFMSPELRQRLPRTQTGDAVQSERKDAAYPATEAEAVRRQLKALGYLD